MVCLSLPDMPRESVAQSTSRAIDIADEFPRAEVIGIDLAPIQPRSVLYPCSSKWIAVNSRDRNVPPNCT